MQTIRELLNNLELHDSSLNSLKMNGDGTLELDIDIDEVWNKNIPKNIKGIVFNSVYEISEFKIDRLNIIESIEIEDISDYDKEFVTHNNNTTTKAIMLSIEFVAGGSLTLVCEDSVGYLK